MRIFLDTEFIEDGRTIELLAIGAVREDDETFYAEVAETDRTLASPWVVENVLPHLKGPILPRAEIAEKFKEFVGSRPQFWGYYADYDWVALCQLYGRMIDLPHGWPMYCRDLKQVADEYRLRLPDDTGIAHHALSDAKWVKDSWEYAQND